MRSTGHRVFRIFNYNKLTESSREESVDDEDSLYVELSAGEAFTGLEPVGPSAVASDFPHSSGCPPRLFENRWKHPDEKLRLKYSGKINFTNRIYVLLNRYLEMLPVPKIRSFLSRKMECISSFFFRNNSDYSNFLIT